MRVKFSHSFVNAVADWSEMKTCQTSLLGKSIFSQVFVNVFRRLLEKQGWNMTNNCEAYGGNQLCKTDCE